MTTHAIDWTAQPLGKITDAALAKRLGVTTAVVTHTRRKLGIPGLRVVNDAERLAGPGAGKIDWSVQPLGKMSDRDLARLLGTHRARVRLARVYRGIPLYVEKDTALDHGRGNDQSQGGAELDQFREWQWYRYPVTAKPCRYCTEARHMRALKKRADTMARCTDQGPSCSGHYVALPSCANCTGPVSHKGDLCEACTNNADRAERERCGWRREVHQMIPALERGDADTVRRGLIAFERKREKQLGGSN
jgi:hypothetical protein